ncbi:PIN2/TERF1-interacting telomerase inhibitor 1 [Genypterus blacodes]|uniref:PIN2/TERF1-interacting telomerase inhibitor 1 n=1 Tax=Genypterus blacodes TaxID=154954 RepID=UPI003F769F96
MSMLAEPRRKQKWSVDPRNSNWSKDESKFGQKLLERMGWSKGKGLGKTEQGSTDHIKVKVKNNSHGLGVNASHEDNWIAHQDDFNELLAQLNSCHGQNSSSDVQPEEPKGFSLEEKSKTSKKRVHYMKFAKGKDLSSRSETDLNCIFGKRSRSAKDPEQENNSSDSQGETEENLTPATSELDPEAITKTVTSTLTMQEYFAQRMAQLKKARGQTQDPPSPRETETSEASGPSEEACPDAEEPKRKKKKKKSRKAAEEMEEDCSAPVVAEESAEQEQACTGTKKKKKKKRKMAEDKEAANVDCSSPCGVEQSCEEQPPSKKKKHKKHKVDPDAVPEDPGVQEERKPKKDKKKKKKKEQE